VRSEELILWKLGIKSEELGVNPLGVRNYADREWEKIRQLWGCRLARRFCMSLHCNDLSSTHA
jgi:hypothetical protein